MLLYAASLFGTTVSVLSRRVVGGTGIEPVTPAV